MKRLTVAGILFFFREHFRRFSRFKSVASSNFAELCFEIESGQGQRHRRIVVRFGYLRVNCSSPATQVDFCSGNEALQIIIIILS